MVNERELIRARTSEGRERAKKNGAKLGRRPKLDRTNAPTSPNSGRRHERKFGVSFARRNSCR
jgi:DNA invertase Pin-like site-specific DNA recombinase